MKPYYQDDFVTLYHGDAREALRRIIEPIVIASDPPWGTGWVRGGGAVGEFVAQHERPVWDVWTTDWLKFSGFVKGGAIMSPLGRAEEVRRRVKNAATIYWRKTNPRPNGPDRDAITIWPAYLPDSLEFRSYNGDTPHHPCQKPLDLMMWILGFLDPTLPVVDPFAGSGSTLIAAKQLGRHAIGVEQNEAYCTTAAQRLSQEVLDLGGAA